MTVERTFVGDRSSVKITSERIGGKIAKRLNSCAFDEFFSELFASRPFERISENDGGMTFVDLKLEKTSSPKETGQAIGPEPVSPIFHTDSTSSFPMEIW